MINISRRLKRSEGQVDQDLHFGQGDLVQIQVARIEYLHVTCDRVKISTRSPLSQTLSSLNRHESTEESAQGDEIIKRVNGVALPKVGFLGISEEVIIYQQFCEHAPTQSDDIF